MRIWSAGPEGIGLIDMHSSLSPAHVYAHIVQLCKDWSLSAGSRVIIIIQFAAGQAAQQTHTAAHIKLNLYTGSKVSLCTIDIHEIYVVWAVYIVPPPPARVSHIWGRLSRDGLYNKPLLLGLSVCPPSIKRHRDKNFILFFFFYVIRVGVVMMWELITRFF